MTGRPAGLVEEFPDDMRAVADVFLMGDGPRTFFFEHHPSLYTGFTVSAVPPQAGLLTVGNAETVQG